MDPATLRDLVPAAMRPWITALLLAMLAGAVVEGIVLSRRSRGGYDWWAFVASIVDAAGRQFTIVVSTGAGLVIAIPLLNWVYEHRWFTITMDSAWAFAMLFVGLEFCYYWYHRSAHRVRWFWATHAVHHSPNQLTLATAVRLGWTGRITGTTLFFAPLIWLGFTPLVVSVALALNLLYQFWLHTTWVPKLGRWFEWVFNTPSHHRVHHGSNPEYLDCNYGGVVIVFDRLFGSFVEERASLPPRYGLTTPLLTRNPLRISFHEWLNLARDLREARSAGDVWRALFAPPASRADAMKAGA
jgi:sterol desaturase/sphingolipid hydroxylase (fatty acid hydroxylase superfamily)